MKLGTKILISFLLIFGLALYYVTHDFLSKIRYRYLEGVEDALVDHSIILAAFLSSEMEKNALPVEKLNLIFETAYNTPFSAKIYQINKTSIDLRVYVTDKNGILLFDSRNRSQPGTDFSQWRDVYLTLRGKYGARSTKEDPSNPASSTLYVAAPVMVNGKIAGVLTVAKPTTSINNFLHTAKRKIKARSIIAGFFVLLFSILITLWLTRPIKHLTEFARKIKDGKKSDLPKMDKSEIGDMGRAFEEMRQALEGKKYVETYVQTLTHEIKSPLSGIKGAAELLEDDMDPEQRLQFLSNIRNETQRVENLVNRMLTLSSIEGMNTLANSERIHFNEMVDIILEKMMPNFSKKNISFIKQLQPDILINGDPILLKLALSNILQNAVDFSPTDGRISIFGEIEEDRLLFSVEDQGPGVPEFATEKVFTKFFSMRRPDTGQKSTGLGLNLVKEITELHNGTICLENIAPHGTRAVFSVPLSSH